MAENMSMNCSVSGDLFREKANLTANEYFHHYNIKVGTDAVINYLAAQILRN